MNHAKQLNFGSVLLAFTAMALVAATAAANINLEYRPTQQTVQVGDVIQVGLFVVSDDPEADQSLSSMSVIIAWDPADLDLIGIDCGGCPNWIFSGFPDDPFGLNEVIPPQDGDGLYVGLAALGVPVVATPEGTRATTLRFVALRPAAPTTLRILSSGGTPATHTVVYDGHVPNLNVTGTISNADVTIECLLCLGDLNRDGLVDLVDLAMMLSHYGMIGGITPQEGDMDCDEDVDLIDLALLLSNYGTVCP
ncbi:MAG: hypothetical protein AMXMBFR47_16550 [Planctomycetota bacterium]